MSEQENMTALRHWVKEGLNKYDLSKIDEIIAPDYVDRSALPGAPKGREAFRQLLTEFVAAFPDLVETTDDMIASGDKVVTRWRIEATHMGEFMGISPTGKRVTTTGIHIYRMVNRQIVEVWRASDVQDLRAQIDCGPVKEQADA